MNSTTISPNFSSFIARYLQKENYQHRSSFTAWLNYTKYDQEENTRNDNDDFASSILEPAQDVSVDAVLSSLFFNVVLFFVLMGAYEIMRRLLPTVYSSQLRLYHAKGGYILEEANGKEIVIPVLNNTNASTNASTHQSSLSTLIQQQHRPHDSDLPSHHNKNQNSNQNYDQNQDQNRNMKQHHQTNQQQVTSPTHQSHGEDGDSFCSSENSHVVSCTDDYDLFLSDVVSNNSPLGWIGPLFNISWLHVRKKAGLDGYFFLRYISMCVRITSVLTFWAFFFLVPIYATGLNQNDAQGWYRISAGNIKSDSWRMWAPPIFAYCFTGFIFFAMKQEYRHFLQIRMEFLARGDYADHVNPQHHYSLIVENIPYDLRSDNALFDYFDKIFPGKVHSASVVLNLPEMETLSSRCFSDCRRLEKSIAYYKATNRRPNHIVGASRINLMGIQLATLDWFYCTKNSPIVFCDHNTTERPKKGTRVDSISYYTHELAICNRALSVMQEEKTQVARTGNISPYISNRLTESIDAGLGEAKKAITNSREFSRNDIFLTPKIDTIPQAEMMKSYGSITDKKIQIIWDYEEGGNSSSSNPLFVAYDGKKVMTQEQWLMQKEDHLNTNSVQLSIGNCSENNQQSLKSRIAVRLGLDFAAAGIKFLNRQLDKTYTEVIGSTMSSTGFVTFLDLASVTCAASAPLTTKPKMLEVSVAPSPQEIKWENAHVSKSMLMRRERITNFVLFLGVILWSFPLAAIQVFAKAEFIACIPGMEWILRSGMLSHFVNGYLPVLALLVLIMILPLLFEFVAVGYEHRKTFSDIQTSMLGRYFYYQLATIYITVTAGSLFKALANILDRPSNVLLYLGESLPDMAGYFIAFILTKILIGLPMLFLRFGALCRMLFLYTCIPNKSKLTQCELDSMYKPENVAYGWEFPSQLLVVVILFTYAIICPVILPVGLVYFLGTLVVYKQQVLYVYTPLYESGGSMFPAAIYYTLFGLVCAQCTLLGYLLIRKCEIYILLFMFPLPFFTVWGMGYFRKSYVIPSRLLSMERAREYDREELMLVQQQQQQKNNNCNLDNGIEKKERKKRSKVSSSFLKNAYRQPVLSKKGKEPFFYRRGRHDALTKGSRKMLKHLENTNRSIPTNSNNTDEIIRCLSFDETQMLLASP